MRLNLSYSPTKEIKNRIEFIDHRRYVIRNLVPPGYEAYFQEQARYLSAHTSTKIEGNPLTDEEATLVLVEGANLDKPDQVEKVNLEEAYELISQLALDKSTKVDEGLIRTLNSITLKHLPEARRRGAYRVGSNLIVDADTRALRYRPPPPQWVLELMKGLVEDIEKWREEHPGPVTAALAHFGLISIHPFDDGNGRTARLVADMLLNLTEWSVECMLSISRVILDRHQDYYSSLRETQGESFVENVDATPFVNFHTEALAQSSVYLEEKVILFNKRRDEFIRETHDVLSPRQVTGLMFMLDVGPLSSSLYAAMTGCSGSSAFNDLSDMLSKEIVVREGGGRSTRYKPHPRLLKVVEKVEAA